MENNQTGTYLHNQGLDFFKFVAACLVIFIHVEFPGPIGRFFTCVARCAVPGFFAVSGYFSYGAIGEQILRRMKRLLKLNVYGILLTIVWGCAAVELGSPNMAKFQRSSGSWLLSEFPTWWRMACWVLLDVHPLNGFYWYLTSILKCYGILWCYVQFFGKQKPNYQMLYFAGILLFVLNQLFGVVTYALGYGDYALMLRNTLLFGLPMFAMGMFLRQYGKQIWENFLLTKTKLLWLILLGIGLSLVEYLVIADNEMFFGSVLMLLCIMLLADRYPVPIQNAKLVGLIKACGRWSLGIYMVHAVVVVYGFPMPTQFMEIPYWYYLQLPYVMLFSLIVAIGNDFLWSAIKRRKTRKLEKMRL